MESYNSVQKHLVHTTHRHIYMRRESRELCQRWQNVIQWHTEVTFVTYSHNVQEILKICVFCGLKFTSQLLLDRYVREAVL